MGEKGVTGFQTITRLLKFYATTASSLKLIFDIENKKSNRNF